MQFDGTTLSITGNTTITGSLTAASKSFDIPHPTKEGFRLRYGVLEGPEHGVYFRGNTQSNTILLPEYWDSLVDKNSLSVQLTSIGKSINHYVIEIKDNQIIIGSDTGEINAYFLIQAERIDVEKVWLEYIPS